MRLGEAWLSLTLTCCAAEMQKFPHIGFGYGAWVDHGLPVPPVWFSLQDSR